MLNRQEVNIQTSEDAGLLMYTGIFILRIVDMIILIDGSLVESVALL